MEEEIWKDVPGYEGLYQVSSLGRVKSLYREVFIHNFIRKIPEHLMKPCLSREYFLVNLHKNEKQRVLKVHQLVAMAFLGHIRNGHILIIDHINGIKTDNRVSNLRIVTHRENGSTCFRKNQESYTSKYVGVSWSKKNKKWISMIRVNRKTKFLGLFISEIDASYAYQRELAKLC